MKTFQVCSADAAAAYYAANPDLAAHGDVLFYLSPCEDAKGNVTGWESTGSPPKTNYVPS